MNRQDDLFPLLPYGQIPGHEAAPTSRAAAQSIVPHLGRLQRAVLRFIQERGEQGATDDEIEKALNLRHQSASARRRELVLKHMIRDSHAVRSTRSGRGASVWVAIARKP